MAMGIAVFAAIYGRMYVTQDAAAMQDAIIAVQWRGV